MRASTTRCRRMMREWKMHQPLKNYVFAAQTRSHYPNHMPASNLPQSLTYHADLPCCSEVLDVDGWTANKKVSNSSSLTQHTSLAFWCVWEFWIQRTGTSNCRYEVRVNLSGLKTCDCDLAALQSFSRQQQQQLNNNNNKISYNQKCHRTPSLPWFHW